jgi:hypothetical protein
LEQNSSLDALVDLGIIQQELKKNRFYGELTIRFQAGSIVLLEKKETFKPSDFEMLVGHVEVKHVFQR